MKMALSRWMARRVVAPRLLISSATPFPDIDFAFPFVSRKGCGGQYCSSLFASSSFILEARTSGEVDSRPSRKHIVIEPPLKCNDYIMTGGGNTPKGNWSGEHCSLELRASPMHCQSPPYYFAYTIAGFKTCREQRLTILRGWWF